MTRPDHYIFGTIECKDAIQSSMTPEQWRGYCKGNIIKYLWRYEHKGGYADLCKAEDYLHWLMDAVSVDEPNDSGEDDVEMDGFDKANAILADVVFNLGEIESFLCATNRIGGTE